MAYSSVEKLRAYRKKYYHANAEYRRKKIKQDFFNKIKRLFNLSEIEYLDLLDKQNNRCAICNTETKLHLDHCHKTNKIRAFLCPRCNKGIGHFQDNKELLKKAIKYLDDYEEEIEEKKCDELFHYRHGDLDIEPDSSRGTRLDPPSYS